LHVWEFGLRIIGTNDLHRRFRIATLLAALILGWFSLATIFAESLAPDPKLLSLDFSAPTRPVSDGSLATWSAAAAPLRGDLLANVAVAYALPVLRPGKAPASPEIMAMRESARSSAMHALSFAPHSSHAWLLLAMLQTLEPAQKPAVLEALKMSYLTAPADLSLIPARLRMLAMSTSTTTDVDLANLARGDVRLILTLRPDLKTALSRAYDKGSFDGKSFIYEMARSFDPAFAATLR
jgi:hypothetical protein